MLQTHLLEKIFPKKDKYILHSETISVSSRVRVIIENIRSDGYTTIELDAFYDEFDFYQNLQKKKFKLEEQLNNNEKEPAIHRQLAQLKHQENQLRVNILELALTIESMEDYAKKRALKSAFQHGTLREFEHILPENYLLAQFDKYLENEQEVENTAALLKNNATEFRVKAEITNLDYDRPDRFEKAIFYLEKGERSAEVAADSDFLATYQFKFGLFYYHNAKINNALPKFEKSLLLFNELAENAPKKYLEDQVEAINNIAAIQSRNHNFTTAIQFYDQAVSMLEDVEPVEQQNHYLLALALSNKGNVFFKQNKYDEAAKVFQRTIDIWEKLNQLESAFYKARLANNYNSLGATCKRNFDFKEAEKAYVKACKLRKELAVTDATRHELDYTISLTNLGAFYRTIGRFEEALKCYEDSIKIQERLVKTNPKAWKHLSESYNNLGVYYFYKKDNDQSKVCYNKAIQIRENLAAENPLEYNPDLAKTLLNVAISFARGKDFTNAKPFFEKSLRLYKTLAEENPAAFLPSLEMTHYNFAISLQYGGETSLALKNYQQSLEIIEQIYAQNPKAYLRRLAVTLTKMSTFFMDFFDPPKKAATEKMAKSVLALCTSENIKKYGLELEYNAAHKLLAACGVKVK